jgi:hypothetical protein
LCKNVCHQEDTGHCLQTGVPPWRRYSGLSAKAPSALLIGPDRQIVAFGYDAQRKYADIVEHSSINILTYCVAFFCYCHLLRKYTPCYRVRVMLFSTTFNNISGISWQSVLLIEASSQ